MHQRLRITTIVENTPGAPGLLGEHGLAFWIEAHEHRVLFDTGQGPALFPNAAKLGVDLTTAEAIVLSHGHYDHTGGLRQALEAAPEAALYAHPDAFKPKYAVRGGVGSRAIGVPDLDEPAVRELAGEFIPVTETAEVFPGLFVTGPIARTTDFESVTTSFYLDEKGTRPDNVIDDQAMYIRHAAGTIVILGCAHAGVVNTLEAVSRLTGDRTLHAVLGGMHLSGASRERLERTAEAFARYEMRRIAPMHCTGEKATAFFAQRFPDRFERGMAGSVFEFGDAPG